MRTAVRLAVVAAVLAAAGAASAHDFWIEPSTFRPDGDAAVTVDFRHGENLVGKSAPRDDFRLERFALVAPDGSETPVAGEHGKKPAGSVTLPRDGTWIVAYRSKRRHVDVKAVEWNFYLRLQGLEGILAERESRGESERPGNEVYSRCAKTLLHRGGGDGGGFDRATGLFLEIVPETDPFAARPGDEFTVRVIYRGEPIPGLLLHWYAAADHKAHAAVRTDASGRATAKLPLGGLWLVNAVHMIRSDARETGAEWESFWASLTFELGGETASSPAAAP